VLEEEAPLVILEPPRGPPPVQEFAEGIGQLGAGESGAVYGEGLDDPEIVDREGPAAEGDRVRDPRQLHARPPKFARVTLAKRGALVQKKISCTRTILRRPYVDLPPPETEGLHFILC
jgi:hypothetical protein